MMICHASGCAEKVNQSVTYGEGGTAAPVVISNRSPRDAAAYEDSRRQLTRVEYGVLEDLGPKPVWEQWGMDRPGGKIASGETAGAVEAEAPAPTTRPTPAEAEIRAEIVELPGDRVRIVWVLRNYGGSKVTSTADGNTSRRKINLEPPDLAPLVSVVVQQLGETGTVTPLPRENTLVITCHRNQRDMVVELLSGIDVAPRQVQITAKIFEVSHDFDFQQGAELLLNRIAANDSQDFSSIFNTRRFLETPGDRPFQGSIISLMRVFQDAGINLEVSLQLLADAGLVRIVSEPRMTVAVGQTGYMLAGQELPITSAAISGNVVQTVVTYKPVGVQLYITPQAIGPGSVKLHTISVVSSVSGFTTLPTLTGRNTPLVNPIIDSREAETAVTIDDGHTLVISGMRMIRTTTRENKIPGLGDLPGVGNFFKNHRSQQQLTDLFFFVTPALL
jgi:type II secretory pathway component GspD/PulD (secretin)